jgi:hypothetical protein
MVSLRNHATGAIKYSAGIITPLFDVWRKRRPA